MSTDTPDYSRTMAVLPTSNQSLFNQINHSLTNIKDSNVTLANSLHNVVSLQTIKTQISCTNIWADLQEKPLDLSVNQNNSATALMRLASKSSSFLQRPDFISFNYSVDTGKQMVTDPQPASLSMNVVKRSQSSSASCNILTDAQLNGVEIYSEERMNALLGKLAKLLGTKHSSSTTMVRTESITCLLKRPESVHTQSEWNKETSLESESLEFPCDFNLIYEHPGQLNLKQSSQSVFASLDVSLDKHLTDSELSFQEAETNVSSLTVTVINEQMSDYEQDVEVLTDVELSDEIIEEPKNLNRSESSIKIQLNEHYFQKYNDDQQRFYKISKKQRFRRAQLKKNGLSIIYVFMFLSLFAGLIGPKMQCLS